MKAMLICRSDRGGELRLEDIPEPRLGDHEVLVSVRAASVNRADLAQRAGTRVGDRTTAGPIVAGLDAAGEVVGIGPEVSEVKLGERIMTTVAGGLAERIAVDAGMVIPLPSAWSFEQGAAAVVGLTTEHNALVTSGRLQPGESVVIHAAASGVGLQAVQLASYLDAKPIIGTVRTLRSSQVLSELGATHVVDATSGDLANAILDITEQRGADVVIDHVGGPYLAANITSMAVKGRLVGVGRLGGKSGELDLEALALKRLELIGVTSRTRSLAEKRSVVSAMRRDIGGALETGRLTPKIASVYKWTEAMVAQDVMASNAHLGKIVLVV